MNVQVPPFLKPGDTIGIAATARWITPEQLAPATRLFENWGLRVKLADNLHTAFHQLAGDDNVRATELQKMLDDDEVRAIIIARGGYGTVRIVDSLNFTLFNRSPKWICGYSDVTILHNILARHHIASIHSTMPISFPAATPEALETLRNCLFGQQVSYTVQGSLPGKSTVRILGGNLSVLCSTIGSNLALDAKGALLFLEDVDEMYYHVDRMMMALRRCGAFDGIKGILLGGMTQMKDNTVHYGFQADNGWGFDAVQTVHRFAAEAGLPVLESFPAGHHDDNRAFYLGISAEISTNEKGSEISFNHHPA